MDLKLIFEGKKGWEKEQHYVYHNKNDLSWSISISQPAQSITGALGRPRKPRALYAPAHVQFVGCSVCCYLEFPAPLWLPKIECGAEVQLGVSKACANGHNPLKKRPSG